MYKDFTRQMVLFCTHIPSLEGVNKMYSILQHMSSTDLVY